MAKTTQQLRAEVARTKKELEQAETELAKVEAGVVGVRSQLNDLAVKLSTGAAIASSLAEAATRLKELEAARAPLAERVSMARDAYDEAQEELDAHLAELANLPKTPEAGDIFATLDDIEARGASEELKAWVRASKNLVRVLFAVKDTPAAKVTYGDRTLAQLLNDAVESQIRLLPAVSKAGSGPAISENRLQVPGDASLEYKGVSQGGRDRFHWEVEVEHAGREGRAYVELYLRR